MAAMRQRLLGIVGSGAVLVGGLFAMRWIAEMVGVFDLPLVGVLAVAGVGAFIVGVAAPRVRSALDPAFGWRPPGSSEG
jgi:hypothetical protein